MKTGHFNHFIYSLWPFPPYCRVTLNIVNNPTFVGSGYFTCFEVQCTSLHGLLMYANIVTCPSPCKCVYMKYCKCNLCSFKLALMLNFVDWSPPPRVNRVNLHLRARVLCTHLVAIFCDGVLKFRIGNCVFCEHKSIH